jgi:transcriptional regulator with XRE-family HTH domain
MKLGEKIRQERERQGLSIRMLASASGISDVHLGRIERGPTDPSVSVLAKIASALKKDIIYFLSELMGKTPRNLLRLKELLESRDVEVYALGSVDLSDGTTVEGLIELIECVNSEAVPDKTKGGGSELNVPDPLEVAFSYLKEVRGKDNINFVEELCKRMGVTIIEKPLPEGLRGLCVASKKGRYCILVNEILAKDKLMVIEHEILHILSGGRKSSREEMIEQIERYLKRSSFDVSGFSEGGINAGG